MSAYRHDVAKHPWREARDRLDLVIHWTPALPAGVLGLTDGRRLIFMSSRLTQAERRSTLVHELEHIARGHTCRPHPAEEADVRAAAARRLIPLEDLARAIVWSQDEHELADQLWVDVDTVRARLKALDDFETEYIEKTIAAIEEAP